MKKGVFAIAAAVVAIAVLAVLYIFQPERLTPERAQKALAAEQQLNQIEQKEEQLQLAQAEETETESEGEETVADDAPDNFKVKFETSAGDFVAEFHKDWSPAGAQRVYDLVSSGFFEDARFFRVIEGFMAQFGIAGDPDVQTEWRDKYLPSEPVKQSNTRGRITFAMGGGQSRPGYTNETRTTQLFINFGNNTRLDDMGFAPVGEVVEGMDVVDSLYSGYGEGAPQGQGPSQNLIQGRGNEYLEAEFPQLDYIKSASIVENEE